MSNQDPRHAEAEEDARILAQRLAAERFDGLSGRLVRMDDPEMVWIVLAGRVDVQAAPMREGRIDGMGHHLFEAWPGHLLPGTSPQPIPGAESGAALGYHGRCAAGTVLARTTRARLRGIALDLEALVAIERWVESLAAATAPLPRALSTDLLEADPAQPMPAGAVLCAPHDSIVWTVVERGEALALGDPALPLRPGGHAWPLTEANWITLPAAARVGGHLTPARMASGAVWDDLDAFGRTVLRALGAAHLAQASAAATRQEQRAAWTRERFDEGLIALGHAADARIAAGPRLADAADAWAECFALVAKASGIDLPAAPRQAGLEEAALAAGVAFRTVRLVGDWWRADNGPLLGFLPDDTAPDGQRAVALLPDGPRAYRASRRRGERGIRVDAALAASLSPSAVMLYRPLPATVKSLWGMLRFGARGLGRDVSTVLTMGLLTGLLGLLTPIASGALMESVLPRADLALHIAIIAGLAAAALGNAAFAVVQSIAVTRVQARVDLAAEAGVWNRLLRLKAGFFRENTTGDLADRAGGVSEIRRAITGAATSSLLSGLFSLLSGGLLFWYSSRLALVAMLFAFVVVLIEVALFAVELPRQRQVARSNGGVESITFEMLSAMPKLRAAAAEPRAFARWSQAFAEQARLRRRVAWVGTVRSVLAGIIPLAGMGVIWAGALGALGGGQEGSTAPLLPLGAFIAFQAAFGNFIGGIISLVQAGGTMIGVAPVWERLLPILRAEPETGLGQEPIGTIQGHLAASHVTFAYGPDMPPALDDVSLSVSAGEYVALVGPSGSGKSTLVRLLLGLEQPGAGAVYADGMDLATVDLAAFRQQIGVVMQGSQLIAGSLLENILGSALLPESVAWEAARQAGLAQDIRNMPMQMQTVVSEGGGGLSGGQRQRLLIARALVRKPRLLIFDEATSALDNATQSEVKESLDKLNVTRIVVAHRLSTIRDVHQIVVMDRGRIVEQGSYDALMDSGGLFAALAARQMA
jgi:NHLM bacteriocin system ABC transporter ATP-binding protein